MHGNVWEWVEDCWNENYDSAPSNGSAWTSGDCSSRVVRGGSWNSDVNKLRSATRGWNDPGGRNRSIGFRVARDL
jgi:formylglycine-generating enzyme required for sulfatase activity